LYRDHPEVKKRKWMNVDRKIGRKNKIIGLEERDIKESRAGEK
jgi:hypothetical protein